MKRCALFSVWHHDTINVWCILDLFPKSFMSLLSPRYCRNGWKNGLHDREGETSDHLLQSFAAHLYFVYVHPFCDGNGRVARILNASHLYHGGYKKWRACLLLMQSTINWAVIMPACLIRKQSWRVLKMDDGIWLRLFPTCWMPLNGVWLIQRFLRIHCLRLRESFWAAWI